MADPVLDQLDALEKAAKDANDDNVVNAVTKLRTEYKGSKDPIQKEAVAKAIPDVTKGVLSAVTAFKEGDAIGGSAAIMDILAGASAALGPEGALVGALFSMISMILSFFEPKQPSLLDQIKEFMIDLEGVKEKDQLQSISNIVGVYVNVCEAYITVPPTSSDRPHNGINHPGPLTDAVTDLNVLAGPVAQTIWYAQQWLTETKYEDAEAWPVVLNLHCVVYARLRTAITRQYIYACDKDRRTKYIDEPKDDWTTRERDWNRLQSKLIETINIMVKSDEYTSSFLTKVVPLARKRGLYFMRWDRDQIAVGTGTKVKGLGGAYCGMSITPPRGGLIDAHGPYDVWLVDSDAVASRRKFDIQKLDWSDAEVIHRSADDPDHHLFLDCWPVPISGAPNKFQIFTALTWGTGSALHKYDWDSDAKTFVREDWRLYRDDMWAQVRVATPAAPLPDDPDKDAMPESHVNKPSITYATRGGDGSGFGKQIWALAFSGEKDNLPVTMSGCYGIAVDPHFLWLYGRDGFVCASHASVLSCIQGKRATPYWLGNGQPKPFPGGNVLALSSCEDGTLFALASGNKAKTARYHVDFKNGPHEAGWLVIDEDWQDIPGAGGIECQKLPVFGWPRVEALAALLSHQKSK